MILTRDKIIPYIKNNLHDASFSERYGSLTNKDKLYYEKYSSTVSYIDKPRYFAAFDIHGIDFNMLENNVLGVPIFINGNFRKEFKKQIKRNFQQSFICLKEHSIFYELYEVLSFDRFVSTIRPIKEGYY